MNNTSIGQPGDAGRNDQTPAGDAGQRTLGEQGNEEPAVTAAPSHDRHAHVENLLLEKLEQHQRERGTQPGTADSPT